MFCPNCSAKNTSDQRFCRSCGMNLEQVSAAMVDQYPTGSSIDFDRAEKRIERFGSIAFGGFGIVLFLAIIGIIYTIVTKMIFAGEQPLAGVLLVAFIVFAALTLTYVVFKEDLKEKHAANAIRREIELQPDFEVGESNLLNQPPASHAASVVEDTTELLPILNKPSK